MWPRLFLTADALRFYLDSGAVNGRLDSTCSQIENIRWQTTRSTSLVRNAEWHSRCQSLSLQASRSSAPAAVSYSLRPLRLFPLPAVSPATAASVRHSIFLRGEAHSRYHLGTARRLAGLTVSRRRCRGSRLPCRALSGASPSGLPSRKTKSKRPTCRRRRQRSTTGHFHEPQRMDRNRGRESARRGRSSLLWELLSSSSSELPCSPE